MNKQNQNCNKTSNNKYFDCPALMSDGRLMTDYRSSNTLNDMIRISNNTLSSYEYRNFLTNNASNIMKINNDYISNKNSCKSGQMITVPFSNVCSYNTQVGVCNKTNAPLGIGLKNEVNKNIPMCAPNQNSNCYFNDANNMNSEAGFYNGMNTPFNNFAQYN
jgi:hypothetical protein